MEIINKNVKLYTMTIEDLISIKDILFNEFDDFWSFNVFKSELENKNSKYIIAKTNDEIIGFAGIWQVQDEAHITNIVTKKNYRKKGIATLMILYLIDLCKKSNNINLLTLEVDEKNIVAQNLYKKFNFQILGKRKNYYKNNSAIIMTLYFN